MMYLLVSLKGSFSVTTLETSSERSNVYSVIFLTIFTPSRKSKMAGLTSLTKSLHFPAFKRNTCAKNALSYHILKSFLCVRASAVGGYEIKNTFCYVHHCH